MPELKEAVAADLAVRYTKPGGWVRSQSAELRSGTEHVGTGALTRAGEQNSPENPGCLPKGCCHAPNHR